MAFEALNNAGVTDNVRLLVILNDNDMSISPAVGALNRYLARLMSGKFYATAKQAGKQVLKSFPPVFELAKKFEEHAKGMVVPGTLFEEFGFNYIGPDRWARSRFIVADIAELETARRAAKRPAVSARRHQKGSGLQAR